MQNQSLVSELINLLIQATSQNNQVRINAQQALKKAQQTDLKQVITYTFQIITNPQQNIRVLGCSHLRNILTISSKLPDMNSLFYTTFKFLYGRFKQADTLLQCLGLYLSKSQVRLHRKVFFDKIIPELMKNNDDLALMFMIRAVLKANPYISGLNQGNQLLFKVVRSPNFVKNQSWVWADTKVLMARYIKFSMRWQTLQRMLMDHSNRKTVVLSIIKYIADFLDILETAEQCIYLFCFIKHMIDNMGTKDFEEDQLQIVLYVWSRVLNNLADIHLETNSLHNFAVNFAMFSQTMDILVQITEIYQGNSFSLNNQTLKVIQASSSIVNQQKIVEYSHKINKTKHMNSFLLLLSAMPARIIGLFGGDQILQGIIGGKVNINNISSLYFIRKIIKSPLLPLQILAKILGHLNKVIYQSNQIKAKAFAFANYCYCIQCFPSLKQQDVIINFFKIGMELLTHKQVSGQSLDYTEEGLGYLISCNKAISKIHIILIQNIKKMIQSSVYRGPQLLFAKFKTCNIQTQKLIYFYRMLSQTYISHQQFCNAHNMLVHSALFHKNQAIQQEAIDLASKILIFLNKIQSDNSQENVFSVIQSVLNFKALEYLKTCISQLDHSEQFIQNCIQVVLQLAFHQIHFPFVQTFCQSSKYNVDCIIQLISIIKIQKIQSLKDFLKTQEAKYRIQLRQNIQNLIQNMNLEQNEVTIAQIPYKNIDKRSKAYQLFSKDKFMSQGTRKYQILKHLSNVNKIQME